MNPKGSNPVIIPQATAAGVLDGPGATRRQMLTRSALAVATGLVAGGLGRTEVARAASTTSSALWYNVRTYGAFGDGVADDTAAIQSALDACLAAGGGCVYVPPGTYRLSGALLVGSNTLVQGDGTASVLSQTVTQDVLINRNWSNGAGDSDITLRDLALGGNHVAPMGVVYAGVQRGTIHNVRVMDCTHYGIWIWASGEGSGSQGTPSRHVTVSDCHITGVVDVGIELDAAMACTVVGNTITAKSGLAGISVWNGSCDATLVGNVVEGEGTNPPVCAFYVSSLTDSTYPRQTSRITFTGNVARNVQTGFKVTWSQDTLGNQASDVTFSDNSLQSWASTETLGGMGVALYACARVKVCDNHIDSFGTPISVNPSTAGGCSAITLDNNRVNGGRSSQIYGLGSGSFSGNVFVNLGNCGVNFYGVSGLTINNNQAISCGSASIGLVALALFYDYNGSPCSGNVFMGNRTVDTRPARYTAWVGILNGGADYNIMIGNSARGAVSGSAACPNNGSGTHNTIANNVNG